MLGKRGANSIRWKKNIWYSELRAGSRQADVRNSGLIGARREMPGNIRGAEPLLFPNVYLETLLKWKFRVISDIARGAIADYFIIPNDVAVKFIYLTARNPLFSAIGLR